MFRRFPGFSSASVALAACVAIPAVSSGHAAALTPIAESGHVQRSIINSDRKTRAGTLRVVVTGTGSYSVIGKGTCKVAGRSKSYKLPQGKYRIDGDGTRPRPASVVVGADKVKSVRVSFKKESPPGSLRRVSTNGAGVPGNADSDGAAVWSPDGTRIAFMSTATNFGSGKGGGLYVKNLVTGRMERIASFIPDFGVLNFAGNVTWSPDGSRIAFDTSDPGLVPGDSNGVTDVFVVNLATKEVVRASVDEQGRQAGNVSESYTPAWSPDSTKLAFVSDQLIPEDDDLLQGIYIKDLTTGKNQYISTGEYHAKAPAWSRDGSRIAWSENGIKVRDIEAGTTTQIVSSSEADNPVWSPDGTQIAYDEGSRRVYVIDVLSGQRKPVSVDQRGRRTGSQSWGARWSPDGSRIVFNSVGNSGGRVLMKDLVSGELVTVSTNSRGKQADNGSYFGSWSPDGKRIVFTSGAANLVPCDGTGPGPGGHFDVFVKTLA